MRTRERQPAISRRLAWTAIMATGFAAGALFGPTLATAATKATEVFITNTATDPVPVTGTVNVGNLPTTQAVSGTVSVGNLPATQAVSGTVNVGSLPAAAIVNGGLTQSSTTTPNGSSSVSFSSVNVVAVDFWSDGLAYMSINGNSVGNGYQITSAGHESVTQTFFNPLPTNSIVVSCDISNATPCRWRWAIAGI